MKLSVVIPTRNEADNIANCIHAFDAFREDVELIVVDNASTDETKKIAAELGAKVLDKGPERSAQRNLGWKTAAADWVVFLDADMILPQETVKEIFAILSSPSPLSFASPQAYWIPEVRSGSGLRVRARNFERSFYNGTCIDGLRLVRRELLEKVGGYDENLTACEDWDLDRRLIAAGANPGMLSGHLIHNEAKQGLKRFLKKKAYYSTSIAVYRTKWCEDEACRKQFGLGYRFFGVFVENGKWKKLARHPILAVVMYFERILVGFTYLVNK